MQARWDELAPKQVASVLSGLGRLGATLPSGLLQELLNSMRRRIGDLDSADLARCVLGVAQLRNWPGHPWMQAFVARSLQCMGSMSVRHAMHIVWSVRLLSTLEPEGGADMTTADTSSCKTLPLSMWLCCAAV